MGLLKALLGDGLARAMAQDALDFARHQRQMVLSAAYRKASSVVRATTWLDARNLFWNYESMHLEATVARQNFWQLLRELPKDATIVFDDGTRTSVADLLEEVPVVGIDKVLRKGWLKVSLRRSSEAITKAAERVKRGPKQRSKKAKK